ncbi:tetratricopeptide repeat protein [Nonomuraea sp. KC401]|uniref:AfsR/SARP family transcriptional regulator n=1 Tax=unclassified Nonomuraea TaxID=2593643 RepID=UPI0010FD7551|nr:MULTISPECIES: BTAD domain-containing putative transcriptional regulator [unclassified Nonomuraea]NBE94027.1 tetratricopeptide repeat protein [Nonomuraea sp. K271]TLF74565.1 tetratricopeptide repeat protein [Nonomuraea sp. KC401]
MSITFHVLGPLEVRSAGRPVRISGRKPRLLLATLLLDAGRVVGADQLVEVLWPHRPPRSAQANVRTYVSALRSELGRGHLRADGCGYAIDVADGALDLLAFEKLVDRGEYAQALALWRGAPLCDLPGSPVWDRRLELLHQGRLRAAEALIDRRLERGDHDGAISELRGLLAEHPYREDLWRRLVLTLHRGGRKAEALRVYATVRGRLVDELGVEPGAELRGAYELILADDTLPATPRQLPPDLPDFTGRAAAMAELAGPFSVAVISGPPGAGKSALAVHAAHTLCPSFPDGQLYLELDGRDPGDLLAEALRALGVEAAPPTVRERSALFRSLLAERPMLVVLDDARDAHQVRPLLPGNGSAVIVTSRRRITELPGAVRIQLGRLGQEEALSLLGDIAGEDRVAREREAAQAIVAACEWLPLAVRNAGARLAGRPGWSLAVLRQRLEDDCLGELRDVRATLDHGYTRLPDEAARILGTLGRLGEPAQPGWVIEAALGRHGAHDVTDLLVDVNLLDLVGTDPVGQPRYRVPGLIGGHALKRGGATSGVRGEPGGLDALSRVLAAWTAITEHAMARLPTTVFTLTAARAPRWRLPERTLERLTTDPVAWFEAEHEALAGAVDVAAELGLAESAWALAAAMVPCLDLRCHLGTWRRTHTSALAAARAAGDAYGEAAMLRGLAQVSLYQDRYEESAEGFTRSLQIFHDLGDSRAEATSLCGLGAVSQFRGRHARSLSHFRHALAIFLATGDRQGEAYTRQAIGRVCLKSGDLAQASESLDQAMRLAQELGDAHREGCVCVQMGHLHRAMSFHRHALEIFESLGDRHCGAYALQSLAGLQAERGDLARASTGLERSLEIFQELGDRSGEASTTELLGELHRSAGRTGLALDYLRHARALRRDLPA